MGKFLKDTIKGSRGSRPTNINRYTKAFVGGIIAHIKGVKPIDVKKRLGVRLASFRGVQAKAVVEVAVAAVAIVWIYQVVVAAVAALVAVAVAIVWIYQAVVIAAAVAAALV